MITYIDRSKWPPGPWDDEPEDYMAWYHRGIACLMVRTPDMGHWCGYVGLEQGHPWMFSGADWSVEVHGGISGHAGSAEGFSVELHAELQRTFGFDYATRLTWPGFDCAHAGDRWPSSGPRLTQLRASLGYEIGIYRTRDWVKAEVNRLADQAVDAIRMLN